jgi:hypothetical protein
MRSPYQGSFKGVLRYSRYSRFPASHSKSDSPPKNSRKAHTVGIISHVVKYISKPTHITVVWYRFGVAPPSTDEHALPQDGTYQVHLLPHLVVVKALIVPPSTAVWTVLMACGGHIGSTCEFWRGGFWGPRSCRTRREDELHWFAWMSMCAISRGWLRYSSV